MKLYTKTGDKGETSLIYGRRIAKDDLRVETYGTLDEANSVLGLAAQALREDESCADLLRIVARIQRDLFDVGRDLATPEDKQGEPFVTADHVSTLEGVIDRLDAQVPPLTQFILPGGALAAAHLHHARTIVRRAERLVVTLSREQKVSLNIGIYLNRLSDLLFITARTVNHRLGVTEPHVDFNAAAESLEEGV
ncbi:cob(I)yrinic acid a,c-diamide adenosyltransferase [Ferroacidibacillus organovorans]|uniref:Corrinoid adenosyltransferase n=1 Tax=Ferroacidibacillus organovorans TaxID=1765683 RepID=A0A162TTV5_9BACL|nr:cob(I)yrinic acid a,c-diamide adenosyltransferase [Ferroacidibacillus organovorans]KYP81125.1 cobalamin adenosyltransferase [Ferroacidibacillus organovorans]OAG92226.1 cobalamin adenosyltransferase [Ferroacidibacillus organovorans]OPG16330.1 ATP:cob(I)alamin adenosyltransferase [Ferroacidibacillus organovorans]